MVRVGHYILLTSHHTVDSVHIFRERHSIHLHWSTCSMKWLKAKSTGNHRFSHWILGLKHLQPVKFPSNQSIDISHDASHANLSTASNLLPGFHHTLSDITLLLIIELHVRTYIYIYLYTCTCTNTHTHIYIYAYVRVYIYKYTMYIYIYIYICMCVCVRHTHVTYEDTNAIFIRTRLPGLRKAPGMAKAGHF